MDAVEFGILRRRLRSRRQRPDLRRFVDRGCAQVECVDATDEHVALRPRRDRERIRANVVGRVAARIDDHIGRDRGKQRDVGGSIAAKLLVSRKERVSRGAAVKKCDAVAGRDDGFCDMPSDEARTADKQNTHRCPGYRSASAARTMRSCSTACAPP